MAGTHPGRRLRSRIKEKGDRAGNDHSAPERSHQGCRGNDHHGRSFARNGFIAWKGNKNGWHNTKRTAEKDDRDGGQRSPYHYEQRAASSGSWAPSCSGHATAAGGL